MSRSPGGDLGRYRCAATFRRHGVARQIVYVRRQCEECGEDFLPGISNQRFCSRRCYGNKWHRERRRGRRLPTRAELVAMAREAEAAEDEG